MKKISVLFVLFFVSLGVLSAQVEKSVKNSANNSAKVGGTNSTQAVNVVTYDFTTGSGQYYGGAAAAKEVETGVWAMIAGDADGSGVVDAADRSSTWNNRNVPGYNGSDVDLTGVTDAADRSTTWNNRNKSTQVPN
ncbi:MAG: hypothetical protein WAR79_03030 [Melioribacteraceae bacterium]